MRRIEAIVLRRIYVAGPYVLKKAHRRDRNVIYRTCYHGKNTLMLVLRNMFYCIAIV